jgi:streptomycin 6-kinase
MLDRTPGAVRALQQRWSLTAIGEPFTDGTCAWVAPVQLDDGVHAVLKLGVPHFEAEHEAEGLRFWGGDPTVHLLRDDRESGAMLLERCEPGDPLSAVPEAEQHIVIAALLRRLWRTPPPGIFRPLSSLMEYWTAETEAAAARWPDPGLVREGLRLFAELPRTRSENVLLATDLHAGNVLRARREPWLVIDPKPFVGDPAYDATQHLFNLSDPVGGIPPMADLLPIDRDRLRLWSFARAAAEPRDDWSDERLLAIARALAP